MLKFFRKYNKVLLATFMVLLMVVFVGGTALQSFLTPETDYAVFDSRFGEIRTNDRAAARRATELLANFNIDWSRPVYGALKPLELPDWILLTREASHFGTSTGIEAARAIYGGETTGEVINTLAHRLRIKPDQFYDALRQYQSIQLTAQAMSVGTLPSTAAIRMRARDALEKVSIQAVMLPARAFELAGREFSQAEIEAQWQAHRDQEPGAGLAFGYFVDPTIRVQYVKISPDRLAKVIGVANLERKAKRYYEANRESFEFRRLAVAEGDKVPDDAPDYLTWEEAKEKAQDAIRRQQATDTATRIADYLIQSTVQDSLTEEREESGYRKASEVVTKLDYYQELLSRLPKTLDYPSAVTVESTDFFDESSVDSVPEIGLASHRPTGGRFRTFSSMVFKNQAFVPTVPKGNDVNGSDYRALFETFDVPLQSSDGILYVFRVIDHREGHVAKTVDEVRDRVIADLGIKEGYEVALGYAQGLLESIGDGGLQEAFTNDSELDEIFQAYEGSDAGYMVASNVLRHIPSPYQSGPAANVAWIPGGIGNVPAEVVEAWFDLEHTDPSTAVFSLKSRAMVMVVQWQETTPGTEEDYDAQRTQITSQLIGLGRIVVMRDWLDPDQIRARNEFKPIQN